MQFWRQIKSFEIQNVLHFSLFAIRYGFWGYKSLFVNIQCHLQREKLRALLSAICKLIYFWWRQRIKLTTVTSRPGAHDGRGEEGGILPYTCCLGACRQIVHGICASRSLNRVLFFAPVGFVSVSDH